MPVRGGASLVMGTTAWTLSFLRPYRFRMLGIAVLCGAEVALGVLAPWPLKAVVDNVLGGHPLPAPFAGIVTALVGSNAAALLILIVVAGLALQIVNELVLMWHTQLQVNTAQGIVYDLRDRLLQQLQGLTLRHHVQAKTADSVYRLEADAYCVSDIVMGGAFPLATSALKLIVMLVILLRLDFTLALLSLVVVPFLYACLRHYSRQMFQQAEDVKARESALVERAYEILSSIIIIKSFTRERQRAGALQGRRPRDDAGAPAAHLAGIPDVAGGQRHHARRHGAGAGGGRLARPGRNADRGKPPGGGGLPGGGLQPAVVDRPHHGIAAAGAGQRAARPRDLRAGARGPGRPGFTRRVVGDRRHPVRAGRLRLRRLAAHSAGRDVRRRIRASWSRWWA